MSPVTHAFFEAQAEYAYEQRWLPMLDDPSALNRYKAMRAFLAFPEWGLPLIRKSVENAESINSAWRKAMLLGMIGAHEDAPFLLKIWLKRKQQKETSNPTHSKIWLGAIQRLYKKHYVPDSRLPEVSSLNIKLQNSLKNSENIYPARISIQIRNPAPFDRFVRMNVHLWKTRIQENIPDRYYWIHAGGRIETSLAMNLYPIKRTGNLRLDFKISDVGASNSMVHKTKYIRLP